MKRFFVLMSLMGVILTVGVAGNVYASSYSYGDGTDYVTSDEWWSQLGYDGYIQLQPCHYCDVLGAYAYVGWIDYKRDGESVIGGAQWTDWPSSFSSSDIYSANVSAWDSLNPWASKTSFSFDFCTYTDDTL